MELVWRAYNVTTGANYRAVFASAVLPDGRRAYRKQVWRVPTTGDRYLNGTWYGWTSDLLGDAFPELQQLLKASAAQGERMEQLAREFMLAPLVRLDLGTDNGPNYEQA